MAYRLVPPKFVWDTFVNDKLCFIVVNACNDDFSFLFVNADCLQPISNKRKK